MSTDSQNVNVHSCHLLFDHFQFALIHGPYIPGSYVILLFTASNPASITSPIHNWVVFLLWLHPFILSGVIFPLVSSSILGTYRPGKFIFQCPGPCFHHQSHPQLGVVFAFGPPLHSFWNCFSTDLQQPVGHVPTWGVNLSVSYLFAFSYCSWGSQGKNTEVICHSLLQWITFCQTSPL